MKALLLNGPPYSGKDTVGAMIKRLSMQTRPTVLLKFAQPIIDYMLLTWGIDMATVEKDRIHPNLLGATPREVAIAYSERFCKPTFGKGFFGHAQVRRLKELKDIGQELVIYTDSGFADESLPVAQYLGEENLMQIALFREGRSFERDSRNYWDLPGVRRIEFHNDADGLVALETKVNADLYPEILKWLQ